MDIEEKLIIFVQRYECLYNISSKHYMNKNAKNNAWAQISEQLGLSAPDCQKRWKKIRDSFRRSLNLRKDGKSGSASVKHKPIKFEKELEFLKKYVALENSKVSNLDDIPEYFLNDDSESVESPNKENTPPRHEPVSQSQTQNNPKNNRASEILSQYIESEDSTDYFFKSMASKVKGMPNRMKAEVEREIFRIVNDAELKLSEQEDAPVAIYQTRKNSNTDTYTPSNTRNIQTLRRSAPYTYTPSRITHASFISVSSPVSNDETEINDEHLVNYDTGKAYNIQNKNDTYTPSYTRNIQDVRRSDPYTYTPSPVCNDEAEITDAPFTNYEKQ